MSNPSHNPTLPSGDAIKPSSGANHRAPDSYVGMFDVAETISRLCSEGTLDLGLKNFVPGGQASGEPSAQPSQQATASMATTTQSLASLDILSPSLLQTVVNQLAERAGKSVGLIIASKTGRVIQSAHCGWDASRVRMHQSTISKIARELTFVPMTRFSVDAAKVDTVAETKHGGSVFLNELAQALGTPLCVVPIALPGSSGNALVYCEVPPTERSLPADFTNSMVVGSHRSLRRIIVCTRSLLSPSRMRFRA